MCKFYCDTGMKAVLRMLKKMMYNRVEFLCGRIAKKNVKPEEIRSKLLLFYSMEVIQCADVSCLPADTSSIEKILSFFLDIESAPATHQSNSQ